MTARIVRRLREDAQRRGGVPPAAGTGPPPRPGTARRPAEDPVLRERLGRWREGPAPAMVEPELTPHEIASAMRTLAALRVQMSNGQGARIDAHLETGAVSARRLRPEDGYVWEMPGMRVFAIVGVQAFSVDD